jgi:peptide/nickel transport system substrate-binding protein
LLAACTPSTSPSPGAPAATAPAQKSAVRPIVVAPSGGEVPAWSPYSDTATAFNSIWSHVFDPLVEYDWDKKQLVGVLAESWSVDQSARWTFKLRPGVLFHDGSPLTARDVVYSFGRAKNDKDSKQNANVANVAEVQAADDRTVVFTTAKPDAVFPQGIRSILITSQAAGERYGEQADQKQIGTGPFKFLEWARGSHFLVESNEQYHAGAPKVRQVMWKPYPDPASRVAALETREVDLAEAIPTQEAARLEGSANLKVVRVDNVVTYFLGLNPAHKPLDDQRVRRAITMSVDVDSLIKNVLDGAAKRLNGPVPDSLPGYDPSWKPAAYDPEGARKLLAEAGFPNGFDIELNTTSGRYVKDVEINQAIAGQLAKANIRATVKPSEFNAYFAQIREGQLGLYYWVRPDGPDPAYLGPTYYRSGVSKRLSGYKNPQVDALWDQAQREFDPRQREAVLRQVLGLIRDDAPSVFLWTQQDLYGLTRRLNWAGRPDSRVMLHQASADG